MEVETCLKLPGVGMMVHLSEQKTLSNEIVANAIRIATTGCIVIADQILSPNLITFVYTWWIKCSLFMQNGQFNYCKLLAQNSIKFDTDYSRCLWHKSNQSFLITIIPTIMRQMTNYETDEINNTNATHTWHWYIIIKSLRVHTSSQ